MSKSELKRLAIQRAAAQSLAEGANSYGELGFWQDFRCPKCGGGMFGSSKNADGTWTRKCHGNEQWKCDYSALESEDSKHFKTFVPNVKLRGAL